MAEQVFNGIFYDDNDFEVKFERGREFLHYKGELKDLRNYMIPRGMTDLFMMFAGTDITYGPPLYEGIKKVEYLFLNCKSLIEGSKVPKSTINQNGEYDGCSNVKDVKNISEKTESINAFAANCVSLEKMPPIPDSVKEAESAMENCVKIKEFEGGKNVENAKGMCAGMESLQLIPAEFNTLAVENDTFSGCLTLESLMAHMDEKDRSKVMEQLRMVSKNMEAQTKTELTAEERVALADQLVNNLSAGEVSGPDFAE